MNEFHTIKELAELHSVSTRTIEKRLANLILKKKNKILIPLDIVKLLEYRHNTEATPNNEYDVVEGFSNEEYQEFQKRLIEYPILQKNLEYHRNSALSHQRQMEMILRNLEQRNFIEAKDKKLE